MARTKLNVVRRTAIVLDRVLRNGDRLSAADVRERIDGVDGANSRYINVAAKWLRNHGVPVGTVKARQYSVWYQPVTGAEMDEYGARVVSESYSELVSNARSCRYLTGRGSRTARARLVEAAIGLGSYLGKDPDEVVEECKPVPFPKPAVVSRNGS